ncbi:MAG: nucleic acid-binding protein [Nitrospirae bacterium]|nr:MAG: nucleic acid-binding protein [Nitrospirota bacterium]
MIVVSNASPLINISRLKLFHHLLALYEKLVIPEAVFIEVAEKGAGRTGDTEVSAGLKSGFIEKKRVSNALAVSALSEFFGGGEAEAIVLASEISADAILLDDNKARIVAQSMKLHIIGTIGILLELKNKNIIPKVKPYLNEAIKYGFRISPDLYNKVLQKAGE